MSKNIVLKKGLDIPVNGAAEPSLSKTVSPDIVAVEPTALKGFTPRLLVKEGDKVLAGSPVMADKKNAAILLASPVSGTVKEIVRGDKRKLLAVTVQADDVQEYLKSEPACGDAEEVKETLLKAGLWPFIIQRPYGIVADPAATPGAIFVSAFSTAPLAADTEFTLGNRVNDIQAAVNALAKIAPVHIGIADSSSAFAKLENAEVTVFKGKHPAGNVGVQIAAVKPIQKGDIVWTVSLQGLAAIGKYLTKGIYAVRRKVAVAGPAAIETAYVETLPGAPVSEVVKVAEGVRVVGGDALSGENLGVEGYLGFFQDQLTLLREGTEREWFGWAKPFRPKVHSSSWCYFSWLTPGKKYDMDTNLHGGPRAFVETKCFEDVTPIDIFPIYLIKACLAGEIEKMEKFGIYEVLPEDLALCDYVDPSKNEIQAIIQKGIDLMIKEMA